MEIRTCMNNVYIMYMYVCRWIHEKDYSPALPPGTNHAGGLDAIKLLRLEE
jgi:hypothetical protein